jgi:hypothetical protein
MSRMVADTIPAVIPSAARDLLFTVLFEKQIPRCARDDRRVVNPRRHALAEQDV